MNLLVTILIPLFSASAFAHDDCGPKAQPLNGVGIFVAAKVEALKCTRLEIDKAAIIRVDGFDSPTGVSHAYRLKRTAKSSYKSEVRLQLRSAEGEGITEQQISSLKNRIAGCLKRFSPNLKGPNGETLEISLSDDTDVPPSPITVTNQKIRHNSESYSLNMNCSVVLHEILHLHGLVDEYKELTIGAHFNEKTGFLEYDKENSRNGEVAFGCRHHGPESSVMSNHWRALQESNEWELWAQNVCSSTKSDKSFTDPGCPSGTFAEKRRVFQFAGGDYFDITPGKGFSVSATPPQLEAKVPARRTSALEPAHFMAITRPGCIEENKTYYACSTNAYVSQITVDLTKMNMALDPNKYVGGGSGGYGTVQTPLEAPDSDPMFEFNQSHPEGFGFMKGMGTGNFENPMRGPGAPAMFMPQKTQCFDTPAVCHTKGAWLSNDIEAATADH